MIDGLFDIALDTPKYHRRGTLELKSDKDLIAARLRIGDSDEELAFEGSCAGSEFDFAGHDELPGLGEVDYQAHGSVWGNSVTVSCTTDAGKVDIFGTRLSSAAGKPVSSHEYIMSASTGDFTGDDSAMYSGLYADGG